MNGEIAFAIVVILVIIGIVLYFLLDKSRLFEEYLVGVWLADSDYLAKSGINSMILYLGKKKDDGKRGGYLLITDDVADTEILLESTIPWQYDVAATITFPAKIEISKDEQAEVWDENLRFELNIMNGTLHIMDASGEKYFARLHKRHDL